MQKYKALVHYHESILCWVEVKSNSEKIKPVALAVIDLHLSEGTSKSISHKKHFALKVLLCLTNIS